MHFTSQAEQGAIGFKLRQFIGKPVCQIIDITKRMYAASFSGCEDCMLQSRVLEQEQVPRYR